MAAVALLNANCTDRDFPIYFPRCSVMSKGAGRGQALSITYIQYTLRRQTVAAADRVASFRFEVQICISVLAESLVLAERRTFDVRCP